jgi:hypothetical protein
VRAGEPVRWADVEADEAVWIRRALEATLDAER